MYKQGAERRANISENYFVLQLLNLRGNLILKLKSIVTKLQFTVFC